MEDRHTVSEPRPVAMNGSDRNMPSWEVDILRDDTVIVDTFLLNNDVLPPRTNKRGKVVWRLPDTEDKLPSFGTDDRRRILDIFKERKKKRKQEKKKRNLSPSQNGGSGTGGKSERRDTLHASPGEKGQGGGGEGTGTGKDKRDITEKLTGKAKATGKENGSSSENLAKEPDGIGFVENEKGLKQNKRSSQTDRGRGANRNSSNFPLNSHSSIPSSQLPGLGSSPKQSDQVINSSALPGSGQLQSQSHSSQIHTEVPSTPDPSRISLDEPEETSTHDPNNKLPSYPCQTSFIEPPPSDALFVTVPHNERPESLPGQPDASLAVPAARHFISKYYAHFDGSIPGTQIGDLIRYYTSKAQKSVSIGGAHSVVTGRRDISAQILNLAGAAFVVRGVVAQDTADGRGVHILVTGTARTSLNGAAGVVMSSFAHSVSLVPINDAISRYIGGNNKSSEYCPALQEALQIGFPFQIHNDALALLSGDAGLVTPSPVQTPVQMQQVPPPPPGLF